MQVRVFESKDMATGLQMIKKELGPDALILSTKTIRDKSAGILGKRLFEITAAIDGDPPQLHSVYEKNDVTPNTKRNNGREQLTFSQVADDSVDPRFTEDQLTFRHVIDDSLDHYLTDEPARTNTVESPIVKLSSEITNTVSDTSLQGEVSELKDLVKSLVQQISQITEETNSTSILSQSRMRISKAQRFPGTQIHNDQILNDLISHGINIETARTISETIRERLSEQELNDANRVHSTVVDVIQNLIEIVSPVAVKPSTKQQRIAFVGPTGVGKTTTLAKIAAEHLKNHTNSVALITIDTYRIAAVEQIKVYGDIMHLPVDVVITPDQLEQALGKHSDKELILIDTAGRSPKDTLCIDELASFFKTELDIEKHLVLSATTREDELVNTIKQFSSLEIGNTIFTKIDESDTLGVLLNVQLKNPAPLSYLTNGQKVPEDLLHFSSQLVAKLIMSHDKGSLND